MQSYITLGVMKTVRLKLRSEEDHVLHEIVGGFTDEDLALLEKYNAQVERLKESALYERGLPSITNMEWKAGTGMKFTCGEYSNAELYELLHVLRPLILDREPTSFVKVVALLGRRFKDKNYAAHQRTLRKMFEDGELSMYMQITVGTQPILDSSLLHIWLNGTQYHGDTDKAAAWDKLEASLSTQTARGVVITQLQSKVKALLFLAHEASLVLAYRDDA